MNKFALTMLVYTLSLTSVQAAPEIYGKAFMAADYVDQEADYNNSDNALKDADDDSLQLNSYFSRIGLRGSEAMTDTTDVIYRLEYGIDIDGDDSRAFQSRDTYLGLKNNEYGELRVGRNSSVFSYLYDPILNRAYWDNLGTRTLGNSQTVAALNMLDYTRQNNSALWIAPNYKGLQLVVQYAPDESFTNNNSGYGTAVRFEVGDGLTLGVGYSHDIELNGSIETLDLVNSNDATRSINYGGNAFRSTMTVDLDRFSAMTLPVTLGVMYQQADYDFEGADKEKGLILSSKIGLDNLDRPAFLYLQYNQTDNLNGIRNNDSKQLVLGSEYSFKDNIIAHAYIGQNEADYTSPTDPTNSVADIKVFATGIGIEYLF